MNAVNLEMLDFIQLVIASLLVGLALIILKKSFDNVNIYFSLTPIFFAITIFLNVFLIIFPFPSWISTVFYLIAPLGILISAWIIKEGEKFFTIPFNVSFLVIFGIYSFFSIVIEMTALPTDPLLKMFLDFNHVMVAVPLALTSFYYLQFMKLIPDQKTKMLSITFGNLIIVLGLLIRAYSFNQFNEESLFGMIVILLGTFIVLFSFLFFRSNVKH